MSNTINIVRFKDHAYPVSPDDYKTMIEAGYTAARTPIVSLDILKQTMFKGFKIVEHTWKDIYPQIIERFEEAVAAKKLRCKTDEVSVIYLVQPSAEDKDSAQELIGQLSHYLARYSLRMTKQCKEKKSERGTSYLWRLSLAYDIELPNGMFYSDVPPPPTVSALDFKTFRTHFAVEDTSGVPTVTVKTQDKMGDDWVTGTSRTFPKSKLDRQQVYSLVNFLLSNF